jgi:hypothetical protein
MPSLNFYRKAKFRGERILIESICPKCGVIKVGSVLGGLPDWERQHDSACGQRKTRDKLGFLRLRRKRAA